VGADQGVALNGGRFQWHLALAAIARRCSWQRKTTRWRGRVVRLFWRMCLCCVHHIARTLPKHKLQPGLLACLSACLSVRRSTMSSTMRLMSGCLPVCLAVCQAFDLYLFSDDSDNLAFNALPKPCLRALPCPVLPCPSPSCMPGPYIGQLCSSPPWQLHLTSAAWQLALRTLPCLQLPLYWLYSGLPTQHNPSTRRTQP
jgi:hypothetical protein